MAAHTTKWRRRITATGVTAAAVLTPLVAATPANAASLCAPLPDTVPPQVTSVTFSTDTINLNSGPRTVIVTADAVDTSANGAPSGIKRIFVGVSGKDSGAGVRLKRTSGTRADGVWTGAVTIPKNAQPGVWSLRYVSATDEDNNTQEYNRFGSHAQSPTDIALQSGWDTTLTLTGTGPTPPPPVKAGKLTGFGFTPQTVDTTAAPGMVKITANFSAPTPKRVTVFFNKVTGSGRGFEGATILKHSTGSHWVGHLAIHRWLGNSKSVPQLFVTYPANTKPRFRSTNAFQLQARHFPTLLKVTSGVDKTKPVLKTLTITPSSVNTTSGAETVTVTATAGDTQSGVAHVRANLGIRNGMNGSASGLYPFPGLGFLSTSGIGVTLKPVGNKWVGTARFRKCLPSGTWKVQVSLSDHANNFINYSSAKLIAAGLPGTLSVTSTHGDVEPPAVRNATASSQAHTITLDFTEGVKNVDTSTLSIYPMKPKSTRFQHTATVSGIVCSNGTSTVDCSGSGGLLTSAVLSVPSLKAGANYQVYANVDSVTPQLTDGAGNPLQWDFNSTQVTGS